MFKRILTLALSCILTLMVCMPAFAAQSTTMTFSLNRKGLPVQTQDAFLPDRNINDLRLSKPETIFFDQNDILYIADTGNRRIVLFDIKTETIIDEITYSEFKTPRGVYVTLDGEIYVADSSAGAVFCFDSDGNHQRTITKPTSIAFGDTAFAPYRIAVDPRGSLYIVSEGVYNGIIQLSGTGEFLGYFTSNLTTLTWVQVLQNIFFTDVQKEGLIDRVPVTFSNVYADSKGVIYTATMGRENVGIKKHNMAGKDMLSGQNLWTTNATTAITVDKYGIMYATAIGGYISVYAPDGGTIFVFGSDRSTDEDIAGMFTSLMSIAVSSEGHIWALDSEKAFLQSFTPTEYTKSVFRALTLFNEGKYSEAGAEWTSVLRYNQMSVLAHNGLGKSYLYQQQYRDAQTHFEVAGDREYYSQAFWETRNQWLMDSLVYILIVFVFLILCSTALKYLDRKRRVKTAVASFKKRVFEAPRLSNIFFAFSVARHPLDSYYYMRRKEKGTNFSAMLLFLLFFASYMIYLTSKAYIVQYADIEDMDFNVIVGGFFFIAALFVVSNYLVTSINDGEGSISDIFKVLAYSSFPLSVTLLLITAITYVITFNELFLLNFMMMAGFVWSGSVLYLGLQEMHNYSFWNTIKSLIITVIFMVIALIVLFNLSILFSQFTQFGEALIRELIANVQGTY